MWIYLLILSVLFIIVLILYINNKKAAKPEATSYLQRNKLQSMLDKELKPRATPEEEEKEDFRYRSDYSKNLTESESKIFVEKEYDLILNRGITKFKTKKYDAAELEFSKIIESGSPNGAAYYYRGKIKFERNDYVNAINDFDLSVSYGFQNPDLYLQKGISNLHLKNYDKALMDLSTCLTLKPDNIEAHFNKGLVETAMEQYQSALSSFTRIIELNPNHESAYYERGKVYLKMDDKESACADFQDAFKKGCLPAHHYIKTLCNPE